MPFPGKEFHNTRDGSTPRLGIPLKPNGAPKKRFHVFLIKPSKYDRDGYVIRWARAVVISNSLATMNSLTEEAERNQILGPEVEIVPHWIDEFVQRVPVKKIARLAQDPGDRCVVCMVGVQTNQYPRAVDLCRQFKAHGIKSMIGGFHVSGSIAMLPTMPEEIQEAMDEGITIVTGEAEKRWADLLVDAYNGTLKPYYNFLDDLPVLAGSPPPFAPKDKLKYFVPSTLSSFDAGRGCPFKCSFCTIINVQGRSVRTRSPDDVEAIIRRNAAQGVREYFITDDNFARNPNWEGIADRIIYLKEKEKLRVRLMIQVDIARSMVSPHLDTRPS